MKDFSISQIIQNIRQAQKELVAIQMFPEEAQALDSYIERLNEPLLIMVMGEFSTGKSTFINALVGKEIAAVGVLPTTAVITKLCYGENEQVVVHYRDGSSREYSPEEFHRLTAEADAQSNAEHEQIDYVERAMPLPVLRDMTIIDSPGLNALKEAHIEATRRFVAKADTVLWMISAEKAASDTEYQSIEQLTPRLKPIVIVNKMDTFDEEEESGGPESFLQNIRAKLKDKVQAVIGISAEYAFKGKTENDAEKLAASNFSAFDDTVTNVILPNRDAYKVNSLIDEINEWLYGVMAQVQAGEESNKRNEERDYNKYIENRSMLSRVEDAVAMIAQPLKDHCQELTNNTSALMFLGILYDFGLVFEKKEEQAMNAYEKAAVKHNTFAQYVLGRHYLKQKALDKATYWLEKAAQAGYPLATSLLAETENAKAAAEAAARAEAAPKQAEARNEAPKDNKPKPEPAVSNEKKYKMLAVGGVCLAVLFGAFAMLKGDTSKSEKPTASVTQQQAAPANNSSAPKPTQNNSAQKQADNTAQSTQTPSAKKESTPTPTRQSQPSSLHLSLNGICVGHKTQKVRSLLGKEQAITDPYKSGHLRYQYPNLEVVIANGIVTGFVSKNAAAKTERGIHEGSKLQDVFRAYGEDYSKFTYDGETMYEYTMTSINGKTCLQRFAIKNGKVDYISCRVVEGE